jgi:hypothetical protein
MNDFTILQTQRPVPRVSRPSFGRQPFDKLRAGSGHTPRTSPAVWDGTREPSPSTALRAGFSSLGTSDWTTECLGHDTRRAASSKTLCRPRGTPDSLFQPDPPLKRWAIIFRARGAGLVPRPPPDRVPHCERWKLRCNILQCHTQCLVPQRSRPFFWTPTRAHATHQSRSAGRHKKAHRFSGG